MSTKQPRQTKSAESQTEPKKRGRKLKYGSDEERREARRQQNREYRARRREELIKLRRANVETESEGKNNKESKESSD